MEKTVLNRTASTISEMLILFLVRGSNSAERLSKYVKKLCSTEHGANVYLFCATAKRNGKKSEKNIASTSISGAEAVWELYQSCHKDG
jgi:hypothetical protein